jgi:hypothetical protein
MIIVLDTFPASSVGKRPGTTASVLDQCRQWIEACEAAGHRILVPAIAYYEALRELELRQAATQIARLQAFCLQPRRFIPLTTTLPQGSPTLLIGRRQGFPGPHQTRSLFPAMPPDSLPPP